jgi:glycosyltransferase involved in cell wall biosynthesis
MLKISVVIPVRNEADSIAALLDGLLNQSLPPAEILITDGGSTDDTRKIIEEYSHRHPKVRLFCESFALPGRGRNVAARNAANDWLAFVDAGVVPTKDWLERLSECVEHDSSVDVVFGSWMPMIDSLLKECTAIACVYVPNRENLEEVKRARAVISSLMRRSVWESAGGFREDLRSAEDILFINKIARANLNIAYAPAALVCWTMQPTLGRTFKRLAVYSRHNLKAGLGKDWQQPIILRYVVLLLITAHAAILTRWGIVLAAGLLVLMLAIRAGAALWRNRNKFPASVGHTLARFVLLIPLLLTIDLATLTGALDWLIRDKIFSRG